MLLVIDDYSEVKPKMELMVDSLIKCLLQWKGTSLVSTILFYFGCYWFLTLLGKSITKLNIKF